MRDPRERAERSERSGFGGLFLQSTSTRSRAAVKMAMMSVHLLLKKHRR
jgi:hypothetical protein